MRHKLEIPWISRLPVTRWINRPTPLQTYTASLNTEPINREPGKSGQRKCTVKVGKHWYTTTSERGFLNPHH